MAEVAAPPPSPPPAAPAAAPAAGAAPAANAGGGSAGYIGAAVQGLCQVVMTAYNASNQPQQPPPRRA